MTIRIEHGDCRDVIARLVDEGIAVDAVVTDPPYHLTQNSRRGSPRKNDPATPFGRTRIGDKGFMGRVWDGGDLAFQPETWAMIADVMKPGAHLVAFGGTRTYHRMACAIEDAGFELRESLLWLYGSGFPKSLDISKAIDKAANAERAVIGKGKGRTGEAAQPNGGSTFGDDAYQWPGEFALTAPATPEARQWAGWGTSLKPAYEPIILARKPLSEPTVAGNVLKHGVGGINIDAGRVEWPDGKIPEIGTPAWGGPNKKLTVAPTLDGETVQRSGPNASGRWPSNLLHDGSPQVLDAFARFGTRRSAGNYPSDSLTCNNLVYGAMDGRQGQLYDDVGTAARFFSALSYSEEELRFHYSAKASKADRMGTAHPTTKPTSLISWLSKLICPPGGTILDPFAGSGPLAVAAQNLGFNAILIEREAEYVEMIRTRLKHMADKQGGQGRLSF